MTVEELIEKLQQQPYPHLPIAVGWQERPRPNHWRTPPKHWEMTRHEIQTVELDGGIVLITLRDK